MGDGTDRILPGVETVQLKKLLIKLCKKSNILICEGISQLVFNIPMISFAFKTGYSLTICEISTDKVRKKNLLVARGDPWRKTLFMDDRYKNRQKNICDMFHIKTMTQKHFFLYVMDSIQNNTCRQLFRETNIYFKSNQNLTILLDKIEYMMRDIDIKTEYSSKKKSWKYRFLLGRTITR